MVQIYIIKMVASPEVKSICLNQQQYDDLLDTAEDCNPEAYPEECLKIVTVETLNECYYYRETILTCEQAIIKTSLAMHINITNLKEQIKKNLLS